MFWLCSAFDVYSAVLADASSSFEEMHRRNVMGMFGMEIKRHILK